MSSWGIINQKIQKCLSLSTPQERIECLEKLFEETNDGMVIFRLGEEYEAIGKFEDALRCFKEAEKLFPKEKWKNTARTAIRLVQKKLERIKVTRLEELSLQELKPETTLFVVACTREKIWDINLSAPEYVSAQRAYRGATVTKFMNWYNKNRLEKKGFRWLILSAKYGFIEPSHPIRNYDVTFNNVQSGPISDFSLRAQVEYQTRWRENVPLRSFKFVYCIGGPLYVKKTENSFSGIARVIPVDI